MNLNSHHHYRGASGIWGTCDRRELMMHSRQKVSALNFPANRHPHLVFHVCGLADKAITARCSTPEVVLIILFVSMIWRSSNAMEIPFSWSEWSSTFLCRALMSRCRSSRRSWLCRCTANISIALTRRSSSPKSRWLASSHVLSRWVSKGLIRWLRLKRGASAK